MENGRRNISKTGEDGSYHTAQVGPGDRGRKKSIKRYGFDLDLECYTNSSIQYLCHFNDGN